MAATHYVNLSVDRPFIAGKVTTETYELNESTLVVPKPDDPLSMRSQESRMRTPSPTPSEAEELAYLNGTVNKTFFEKFRDRLGLHRQYIVRWIIITIIIILSILLSVYDETIVKALQPTAKKLLSLRAGWLIPIAFMIILSFPPLFGQEIIIILVGITWGLGKGFGIAAAGTILGELCTYYVFRFWCTGWARKQQTKSITYGCLTKVVQDGGVWIPVLVRYSAIPDHFSTAVFATCGMELWVFLVSVFAALPNQVALVYFGVAMEATIVGDTATARTEGIVNDVLIVVSVISTIAAQHVLRKKMQAVMVDVIYQRRKARQTKMLASTYESNDLVARPYGFSPSSSSLA